jgi:hypothetical protein
MLLNYVNNTLPINIYNKNYSYNNERLLFLYILISIILFFLILFYLSIKKRSERIKFKIKRVLLFETLFLIPVFLLLLYSKDHRINFNLNTTIIFIFIIDFLFIIFLPKQKRTRYIPAKTKKKLIENFERTTGKTYNSKKYEIHHIIPYSKGGNNTIDNLKIILKHKNRAISNKSPWWDIFGK